jgi:O-antigen/teichoic acid export membrane protein
MSLRRSMAYVLVRVLSGALAMASLAVIVRGLGPARYGQLTLGMAASALVTQILFNPINSMLARFYGETALREPLFALLRSLLLGSGLFLVLVAGLLDFLGVAPLAGHVLLAAACMATAQGIFDFTGQYLAAAQQSRAYSIQFVAKACMTLLFAWFVLRAGGGAEFVMGAMLFAFLLAVVFSGGARGWLIVPTRAAFAQWSTVVGFAGPLLLTSFLGYLLLWGDRYLLRHLVALEELGRYSSVADLAQQTLGLIFSGLCTAWYPRIVIAWGAKDFAESQRLFGRYAALGLAIVLPVGVGFALVVPDFVPLLYGKDYMGMSSVLLPLVTLAAVVAAVKAYYFDLPLLLARRVWRQSASIACAMLMSLSLAYVAIPYMGTAGAALGLCLGQLSGIVMSVWFSRGVMHHKVVGNLLWPPLVAVLVMAGFLAYWPAQGWMAGVLKIAGGASLYCIVMVFADFDGIRHRVLGRFS